MSTAIPDRWLRSLSEVQREAVKAAAVLIKASYRTDTEREDLIDALTWTLRDMDDAEFWKARDDKDAA